MGSKLKEEERNERTIRALLKQSENRRCINCASLGPQYVCTTFSIFVCTNCSGLHREFTHRIKSVSMAKFTAEEVRNLQAGGNERAREIFLKDYDLQRNPLPDSSNADKLRDFIKSVYVERRYSGERPLPRGRQGDRDRDELFDRRPDQRSEARSDGRSPPFEDRHDDRRFMDRRRSDVDRGRYNDDRVVRFEEKRSPSRFEADRSRYDQKSKYDDRRQQEDKSRYDERERDRRASYDDRFANEIRHDRRRSADDRPSPNTKDFDGDSPPVRPVAEILGDNVPQLWVEEFRQTNGRDDTDWSSQSSPAEQRRDKQIRRPGSFGTANGSTNVPSSAAPSSAAPSTAAPTAAAPSSTAIKRVNSGSLIDFSAEPEPSVVTLPTTDPFQVSAAVVPPSTAVSTSSTGWATFDTAATPTVPADGPPPGYPDVAFATPSNGHEWAASGWPSTQAPSTTPTTDNWSSLGGSSVQQPVMAAASHVLTPWKSFPLGSNPASHSMFLQVQPTLLQESKSSSSLQSVDRSRELPKELFAHSFSSLSMPAGGLGMGQQMPDFAPATQPFGMGGVPTYGQPPRSRNPFDLPGDVGPSTGMGNFPSLGSLQAALPNGPLSMPTSVGPTSSNQWSMGVQPASYPPSGPPGGSGSTYVTQLSMTSSSGMHGQTTGPSLGYSDSGSFNNRGLFQADPSFVGSGSTEFPPQTYMRTLSGNPFG